LKERINAFEASKASLAQLSEKPVKAVKRRGEGKESRRSEEPGELDAAQVACRCPHRSGYLVGRAEWL
jgi:hypothetical protein